MTKLPARSGRSIDYYVRLEQGKESNPSGPILDGLARALRRGPVCADGQGG